MGKIEYTLRNDIDKNKIIKKIEKYYDILTITDHLDGAIYFKNGNQYSVIFHNETDPELIVKNMKALDKKIKNQYVIPLYALDFLNLTDKEWLTESLVIHLFHQKITRDNLPNHPSLAYQTIISPFFIAVTLKHLH